MKKRYWLIGIAGMLAIVALIGCQQPVAPSPGDPGGGGGSDGGGGGGAGHAAEGTAGSPAALTASGDVVSHDGTVDTGKSYYRITGVTGGQDFTVTLTSLTGNVDLYVYDAGSLDPGDLVGSSENAGTTSETVTFALGAQSFFYAVVDGSQTTEGASFELDVVAGSGAADTNEGSVGSPVELGDISGAAVTHEAAVEMGSSYYELATTPGGSYVIALDELSADANLFVYDDAAFTNQIGSSENTGTANDGVTLSLYSGSSVFVEVRWWNAARTEYTLVASDGSIGSEGTSGSPVDLGDASLGDVSYAGTQDLGRASYYQVTVEAGTEVTVELAGLSGPVDLIVDDDEDNVLGFSNESGTADESVVVASASDTTLFVTALPVAGEYGEAAFTVEVSAAPAPVYMGSAVGGFAEIMGEVTGLGTADIYVVDVASGFEYVVDLVGSGNDIDLHVYGDADFSDSLGSGATSSGTEQVTVVPPGSELYLRVRSFHSGTSSYTLTVTEVGAADPGDAPSYPLDMGSAAGGSASTVDSVAAGENRYLTVDVTPGETYGVDLTTTADLDLYVYSDSSFDWTSEIGSSASPGPGNESVSIVAPGTRLYIKVSSFGAGSYELTASERAGAGDLDGTAVTYAGGGGAFDDQTDLLVDFAVAESGSRLAVANVSLFGLSHTFVSDVTITLTTPAGTMLTVYDAGSFSEDFNGDYTFTSDSAETPIGDAPVVGGEITPGTYYVADLNQVLDEDLNGTWTLEFVDAWAGDDGSVTSTELEIEYE